MIAQDVRQGVKISLLEIADAEEYAAFLQSDARALIYYGLNYKAFLEDLLECEASYWIAREEGKITGILPAMKKNGPVGVVINSLPYFGSNGGALARTSASETALVRKFEELSSASDVVTSTWISHPAAAVKYPPAYDFVDERISQITPLVDDPEKLIAGIDGSARRNIRKAQAEGVTVRVDNEAFAFLESAHNAGMVAIGGNAKSSEFFQKVPRHFSPDTDYRIYIAECRGGMCAALLLFYFGRTIEYFTPATVEAARAVQPMALILYHAMLEGASRGYTQWNWGGTWLNQNGIFRFKKKWGALEARYQYYIKVNRGEIRKRSRSELLAGYPGFYLIPFDALDVA